MKIEMVKVTLDENGRYTVEDVSSDYTTHRLYGTKDGMQVDIYYCPKKNWKKYLLKLVSTTEIDRQIAELKERKQKMIELRERLNSEISESEEV